MFEYAISCGEGTLLDYGVADNRSVIDDVWGGTPIESTLIIAYVPDDCETGE